MRYRLIDESQITEYDKKLSNDEIAKCLNDLWGNWWKEVRDKDPITDEELETILTKPKDAITKQYKSLLKIDGVKLTFDKDSLKYIVEEAQKKKIGARGLRGIIDMQMNALMYELPKHENIKDLKITKELLTYSDEEIEEYLNKKEASE